MIAEIQCLPSPTGTPGDRYAHIAAAIATVEGSGLRYEVGALGTTLEGPDDLVWEAVRAAHEATLASGADSTVSVVKVYSSSGPEPTMDALVADHR